MIDVLGLICSRLLENPPMGVTEIYVSSSPKAVEALPVVVINDAGLTGGFGLGYWEQTVSISVYAAEDMQSRRIANAIARLLDGWGGDQTGIMGMMFVSEIPRRVDETTPEIVGQSQTYRVWYQENR